VLVLVAVGVLVLALVVWGEWTDSQLVQRRVPVHLTRGAPGPGLPEPLIPSTIQRNAGNG
jgi:hypothetical protein